MALVRAFWRGLQVVALLLLGALICVHIDLATRLGRRPHWVPRVNRWWFRRLCAALGVQSHVTGRIEPGCLLVANHVSWLDIPLLGAQGEIAFLSKADVRRWPLVGWMCEAVGTQFIERGGNQVAEVVARIGETIAVGGTLAIFPEGTTTHGDQVRRFHPRLFSAVQQPGLRIQPIALSYHRGTDPAPDTSVAYVGDQTLIANLWGLIHHPGLVGRVYCLAPVRPEAGEDRRALSGRARDAIVCALGLESESGLAAGAGRPWSVDGPVGLVAPLACQARD